MRTPTGTATVSSSSNIDGDMLAPARNWCPPVTPGVASAQRHPPHPLDIPFRPGSNDTSADFAAMLRSLGIRQSVGRTGICFDNAMAESFFAALRNERVHRVTCLTKDHAKADIASCIELRAITAGSISVSDTRHRTKPECRNRANAA